MALSDELVVFFVVLFAFFCEEFDFGEFFLAVTNANHRSYIIIMIDKVLTVIRWCD